MKENYFPNYLPNFPIPASPFRHLCLKIVQRLQLKFGLLTLYWSGTWVLSGSVDFPKGGRELMILLCVPGRQSRCNSNSYTGCPLSPLSCPHIKVSSEGGHWGSHTRINSYTIPPVQIYLSKPQMTQICFKVTTLQIKVLLRHVCGYWRSSFTDRRWNVSPCLQVTSFIPSLFYLLNCCTF